MLKYLLAAVAVAAASSPASARDGRPYLGVEGGILFPKESDGDARVEYTSSQVPATPVVAGPLGFETNNVFGIDYNTGYDIDLIAGYDFGMLRLEAELGMKRASLDEFNVNDSFIAALNADLNRPSAAPDVGAPGLPALLATDFDLDGKVKVNSLMVNALFDFGNEDGLSFYAGAGLGGANVKLAGEGDTAWAMQLIAGARYALSQSIDIGLKYRYFRTSNVDLSDDPLAVPGNSNRLNVGTPTAPVFIDQVTNAVVVNDFEQKFRSHSVLASLIFNFGGASEPPPMPEAPPPPPSPPPPATQTCPDGSVVQATDICPTPPPVEAPPPPEAVPERG